MPGATGRRYSGDLCCSHATRHRSAGTPTCGTQTVLRSPPRADAVGWAPRCPLTKRTAAFAPAFDRFAKAALALTKAAGRLVTAEAALVRAAGDVARGTFGRAPGKFAGVLGTVGRTPGNRPPGAETPISGQKRGWVHFVGQVATCRLGVPRCGRLKPALWDWHSIRRPCRPLSWRRCFYRAASE
jgi:hypothetical protein